MLNPIQNLLFDKSTRKLVKSKRGSEGEKCNSEGELGPNSHFVLLCNFVIFFIYVYHIPCFRSSFDKWFASNTWLFPVVMAGWSPCLFIRVIYKQVIYADQWTVPQTLDSYFQIITNLRSLLFLIILVVTRGRPLWFQNCKRARI